MANDESDMTTNKPEKLSHTKNALKILRLLFIVAILCFIQAGLLVYKYNISKLPTSHIYVCDNPNAKHRTDFDLWIKDDLNISWVPTYIIISDGQVVGAFEGCIDVEEFEDKLSTALSYNIQFSEVPDFEIENLDGERTKASEIFSGEGPYILEIVWDACKDCEYQDEHFTDSIYRAHSTKNIYRYYVLSERTNIENKYK